MAFKIKRGDATAPVQGYAGMTLTVPHHAMPRAIEIMQKHGIACPGGQPNPTATQLDPALVAELATIGAVLE